MVPVIVWRKLRSPPSSLDLTTSQLSCFSQSEETLFRTDSVLVLVLSASTFGRKPLDQRRAKLHLWQV